MDKALISQLISTAGKEYGNLYRSGNVNNIGEFANRPEYKGAIDKLTMEQIDAVIARSRARRRSKRSAP